MRIPPLEVILTWPTPNYDNPHTRGEALLVLMVIFSFLVLLAVLGRFYSRLIVKNWFGWDDSMITLALIFTLGMNVTVILANRLYGWNRHLWDVKPNWYQNAMIVAFTAKLLFVFAATFTRMSLVFFYYRLVRDSGIGWFRYVLHASMAFIVALGIGFTCVGIWLCVPVQAYWVFPPIANAKCLDEGIVTLIIGILNCVADLLTTLLPIPLVMRLKMPLKQRIGVCVLLSLGVVVTVAGVVRTYYIWQSLINSWDETWYSYPLWICAAIEIDVAVICACAPALKPLLHKPISRLTSTLSSKLTSLRSSLGRTTHTVPANNNSSNATSRSLRPFRKKSGDSLWDGEEEYGILKRAEEKNQHSAVVVTGAGGDEILELEMRECGGGGGGGGGGRGGRGGSGNGNGRPGKQKRSPTLEILKRQSVDQEVSYLRMERSRSEGEAEAVGGAEEREEARGL